MNEDEEYIIDIKNTSGEDVCEVKLTKEEYDAMVSAGLSMLITDILTRAIEEAT